MFLVTLRLVLAHVLSVYKGQKEFWERPEIYLLYSQHNSDKIYAIS